LWLKFFSAFEKVTSMPRTVNAQSVNFPSTGAMFRRQFALARRAMPLDCPNCSPCTIFFSGRDRRPQV
jgi:hypothetical protein